MRLNRPYNRQMEQLKKRGLLTSREPGKVDRVPDGEAGAGRRRLCLPPLRLCVHRPQECLLPRRVQTLPELRGSLPVSLLPESDVLQEFLWHAHQSVSQGGEKSAGDEESALSAIGMAVIRPRRLQPIGCFVRSQMTLGSRGLKGLHWSILGFG